MSDIENTYEILKIVNPQTWITVGTKFRKSPHFTKKINSGTIEDILC